MLISTISKTNSRTNKNLIKKILINFHKNTSKIMYSNTLFQLDSDTTTYLIWYLTKTSYHEIHHTNHLFIAKYVIRKLIKNIWWWKSSKETPRTKIPKNSKQIVGSYSNFAKYSTLYCCIQNIIFLYNILGLCTLSHIINKIFTFNAKTIQFVRIS